MLLIILKKKKSQTKKLAKDWCFFIGLLKSKKFNTWNLFSDRSKLLMLKKKSFFCFSVFLIFSFQILKRFKIKQKIKLYNTKGGKKKRTIVFSFLFFFFPLFFCYCLSNYILVIFFVSALMKLFSDGKQTPINNSIMQLGSLKIWSYKTDTNFFVFFFLVVD